MSNDHCHLKITAKALLTRRPSLYLRFFQQHAHPRQKSTEIARKAGIKTWGSFMFALLGETPELSEKTLEFAKSLPGDFASFHLTTPFPGTELWRDFSSWGKLENDFSKFTQLNPVFVPYAWNNKEDKPQEMLGKAFREFYLRPKYIIDQFLKIRSIADVKLYYNGLRSLCRVKKEIDSKDLSCSL